MAPAVGGKGPLAGDRGRGSYSRLPLAGPPEVGATRLGPPASPGSDLQAQLAVPSLHWGHEWAPDALGLARPGTKTGRGQRGGPHGPPQAGTVPPHPRPSAGPDGTGMCGAFWMSLPADRPNQSRDPTARASELTASPLSRGRTKSRGWGRPVPGGCPPRSPLTRHAACAPDPPAPRSRRADRKRKREPFQGAGPLSRNVRC